MNKKVVTIVASILLLGTFTVVGTLYSTDAEVDELMQKYYGTTQNFDRVSVQHIISTIEEDEPGINEPGGDAGPGNDDDNQNPPGIPSINPVPIPDNLANIINMSFEDAFSAAVGGADTFENLKVFSPSTETTLKAAQQQCSTTITVPVWQWSNKSGNSTDLSKKSVNINITCNKLIAPLVEAAMKEIHAHASQPVMYYNGCYNIRAMRGGNKTSAHSYGCAIDFNAASTCNGKGNNYTNGVINTPTYTEWSSMDDCQAKYEIFYDGCVVVEIFYKYGFYWGGSWNNTSDGMHFGFLGDNGDKGRIIGQNNAKGRGIIP